MATQKTRVLFVEDDEVDRKAFRRKVIENALDYDVIFASSFSKSKGILAKDSFNVVISDYNLGDGSAFDVLDMSEETPVIFVTGVGNEDIATKAMKSGAYDYIIKDHEKSYLKALCIAIGEAVKYKKAGQGIVEITLTKKGKEIIFSCKDNGISISKKDFKKVFTKFYRSEEAMEIDPTGAGLGLYLNQATVEASGGKIWFSKNKDFGMTFYFSLPVFSASLFISKRAY